MSASSKVSCSLSRIRTRIVEGFEVFERFEEFEWFEEFERFEGVEGR